MPELNDEEKIAILQTKSQADEAVVSLVEAIMPKKIETYPAHTERQSWAYHFYQDPVLQGDKIEVIVLKNGAEIAHMTHEVKEEIPVDMECRPFVQYFPTVCASFEKVENPE
jgi:hypothetical protein